MLRKRSRKGVVYSRSIPHICHFFYTGRIFESQTFTPKNYKIHPKITTNTPKKRKYALFLHFILKNLHLTYFFTRAPPVVPVTNMRYAGPLSKLILTFFLAYIGQINCT